MQYVFLVDSLGLIGLLALFLLLILMLWGTVIGSGRSRNLSLLGFLTSLGVIADFLVVYLSVRGIISFTEWGTWGRYVSFGAKGIWLFLISIYMIMWAFPDLFSERKWIIFIALILPLIYEILMFIALPELTYVDIWLTLQVTLIVIYMALIPLFATFRYTKREDVRGTPRALWIWVTTLGVLIWFIGAFVLGVGMLFQLPGYDSWFSGLQAFVISAHTIGWIIMLLGFVFQRRVMLPSAT